MSLASLARRFLRATRFLRNPVTFGTVMSFMFVWIASDSIEWALAAGFIVLTILQGMLEAVELLLNELRQAGLLPTLKGHRSHVPDPDGPRDSGK